MFQHLSHSYIAQNEVTDLKSNILQMNRLSHKRVLFLARFGPFKFCYTELQLQFQFQTILQ
jgi:hypothetical protein